MKLPLILLIAGLVLLMRSAYGQANQLLIYADAKDIWTTSLYSYAPGGNSPGGGEDNDYLRIGGWGDRYLSLIQFNIESMPANAVSVVLRLYAIPTGSNPTGFYLDRITEAWDWRTTGTGRDRNRMWWADRPDAVQWSPSAHPAPTRNAWCEINITSLYNAWKKGSVPNYGLQIRPASTSSNNFEQFYSANYAVTSFRPQLVITTDTACRPLAGHQHNPAHGLQSLMFPQISANGLYSFIFSTANTGNICIVSSSDDMKQWCALSVFTPTTAGTEVTDKPLDSQKFYRITSAPSGVSIAEKFVYPIGSGDVPEQIMPERNTLFPDSPTDNPDRSASTPGAGWYNYQDVGSYYALVGGLHPGEDWNKGSGDADVGEPVAAIANGKIIGIKPVSGSGASTNGYVVLVRHWLLNGDTVDSLYVHVAADKVAGSPNTAGTIGSEADFTYQPGSAVNKGDIIGVVANIAGPHLHLEIRNTETDFASLWVSDIGNGYYGPEPGVGGSRKSGIITSEVQAAMALMKRDGIIDPSDFIDDHR